MTTAEAIKKIEDLVNEQPVYMWGANGEIITRERVEWLKDRYVSRNHTADYYNSKLEKYRGRRALDDAGLINFLCGTDLTIGEHVKLATKSIHPSNIDRNRNMLWVLLSVTKCGTITVGIYLGDTQKIVVVGYDGLVYVPVSDEELQKWGLAIIPSCIDLEKDLDISTDVIIERYQEWLTEYASSRGFGGVSRSGKYDAQTVSLSRAIAKQIYGDVVGTPFDATADITIRDINTSVECASIAINRYTDEYAVLMYIISVRLYAMGYFDTFPEYWGTGKVIIEKDFGLRLAAVKDGIKRFIPHNRYLDSIEITLTLLRELFM